MQWGARMGARAPKILHDALQTFLRASEKFWRARALMRSFINFFDLGPPSKKSQISKFQRAVFLARARQKFQKSKFELFYACFIHFLNISARARGVALTSCFKVHFGPKNGLRKSKSRARGFLRARAFFQKM